MNSQDRCFIITPILSQQKLKLTLIKDCKKYVL